MKRFYNEVTVAATEGSYVIELDGRIVKTPGKETLTVPTFALVETVAEEWRAQGDDIDVNTMPVTKLANTALDRVQPRFEAVAADIANFAGTDLLCYRADEPAELAVRQNNVWNPYLDWTESTLSAKLVTTDGIMPIRQSDAAIKAIAGAVNACDPFELTALHEFTNGFGSVVLALAYIKEFAPFEAVWEASVLDQAYQEEQWGEDYEAIEKKEKLLADLKVACQFLSQVRNKIAGQPG